MPTSSTAPTRSPTIRELMDAMGDFQYQVHSLEGRGAYVLARLELTTEGPSSGA